MRYLYVDNYRGFSSTYLPIRDVNFFVGENSTGKSSILNLINLIGYPEFWVRPDFNNSEVELGVFKDIVSATSANKRTFQIGVIEFDDEEEFPTNKQRTYLLTFIDDKGSPVVKDYSFIRGNDQIRITFTKSSAMFKIAKIDGKSDLKETLLSTFKEWIENRAEQGKGYKRIKSGGIRFGQYGNLMFVRALVEQMIRNNNKRDENVEVDFNTMVSALDPPSFARQITWIAPIRSKPARIYSGIKTTYTPEGAHTPMLIKDLLQRERSSETFKEYTKSFGRESGLFEGIYIKNFGRSFTSPFELGVKINENELRVSDVGYGVSQSLPIVVELFARPPESWFALQQPEVHLHPKAQASLGDLILDLANEEGKRFFIETHSDYLINRFRTRYRDCKQSISCQVIFFEKNAEGNRIHTIPIQDDGNYSDNQPKSFREFFINEELRVLGL